LTAIGKITVIKILWHGKNDRIKRDIFVKDYEEGWLKCWI